MPRSFPTSVLVAVALLTAACKPGVAVTSGVTSSPVMRVWSARSGTTVPFDEVIRAAAQSDFVFFGEQHDDPVTHAAELALLAGVGERRARVVVSLEMFERDVQQSLDDYLGGRITEAAFLAASRPWDRYATDYRALVELARVRGWPVVASNIPRRLASGVSRGSLRVLDTLNAGDKRWIAREHRCPKDDEYFRRFAESMQGHGNGGPSGQALDEASKRMVERFYEAQCTKDEAMGEAVAEAARAHPGAIVVHYDGAFHSDYRLGTVGRALLRAPGTKSLVISAIPIASLDSLPLEAHRGKADYLVFTRRIATPPPSR